MVDTIYHIDRLFIIGGYVWKRDADMKCMPDLEVVVPIALPIILHDSPTESGIGISEDNARCNFVFRLGAYKLINAKQIQAEYYLVEVKQ